MAEEFPKPEELIQIDHRAPSTDWMETPIDIRPGMYCYASNPKSVDYVGLPAEIGKLVKKRLADKKTGSMFENNKDASLLEGLKN